MVRDGKCRSCLISKRSSGTCTAMRAKVFASYQVVVIPWQPVLSLKVLDAPQDSAVMTGA